MLLRRTVARLILAGAIISSVSLFSLEPESPRVPWTSSRVRGSPEPPPPYRVERAFPGLKFSSPVEILRVPGSTRLLVAELGGKIWTFEPAPDTASADLFLDVRPLAPDAAALYGAAFHPQFAANRRFFICYAVGDGKPDGTVVAEFRAGDGEPPRVDPASRVPVITWRSGGHNGGCLQFGLDGCLYVSSGDGVGPFPPDTLRTGQDNSDLLSAILRLDVDRPEPGKGYRVPPDNPFVTLEGVRPEVWAYGFRNPWKMSVDPRSGRLWVGDVGWELWELVYLVEAGGNYGWSITEGRQPVHPDAPRGPTPILAPLVEHSHTEARSITSGFVYPGKRLPALTGAYIYGDYETGKLWALAHDGEKVLWHREIADSPLRIVGFGLDAEGELLILDHVEGGIYRLESQPEAEAGAGFPRRLGETGIFADAAALEPAPGVAAYYYSDRFSPRTRRKQGTKGRFEPEIRSLESY
jgi:glucose/arabinose dehydrogenase